MIVDRADDVDVIGKIQLGAAQLQKMWTLILRQHGEIFQGRLIRHKRWLRHTLRDPVQTKGASSARMRRRKHPTRGL